MHDVLRSMIFPRCRGELGKIKKGKQEVLIHTDTHRLQQYRGIFDEKDTVRCRLRLSRRRQIPGHDSQSSFNIMSETCIAGMFTVVLSDLEIGVGCRITGYRASCS